MAGRATGRQRGVKRGLAAARLRWLVSSGRFSVVVQAPAVGGQAPMSISKRFRQARGRA